VALFIIPSVNFSQAQRLLGLGTPEDVFFLNKDTALFAISERAIAVTYNGWDSFHYTELRDWATTERNLIRTVTMNSNGLGYISGAGNCLWRTTDFGKSFQIISGSGGGSGGGRLIRFIDDDHLLYADSYNVEKTALDLNYKQEVTTMGSNGWLKQQFSKEFIVVNETFIKCITHENLGIIEFKRPYSTFDFRDASYIDSNLLYAITPSAFVRMNQSGEISYSASMFASYAMEFVNADTGIVAGSQGIKVTHDSGNNWTSITEDDLEDSLGFHFNQLYTIRWISGHEVYLFGDFGAILFSDDAGLTWQLKHYFGTQNDMSDVVTDTLGNLYVGAYAGSGISTDSGSTWHFIQHTPVGNLAQEFNAIHHWSPDFAIATSSSNNTLKTSDAWTTVSSSLSDELYDIGFLDASIGFGVGYNAWYKTTDSGSSWSALSGLQTVDGNNIEFYNGYLGMSATDNGVYVSSDSGDSWTLNNFASNVEDISIVHDSLAYAINYGGGIYKSLNQGTSWSLIHSMGVYGRGVATYGLNKIIGVGHDGGVSTSSDGGTTWHKQTIGEYANLVGVSFLLNDFFISDDYCAVFKMDSCLATIQPREDTLCNENDLVFDVSGLPAGIRQWYLNGQLLSTGSTDSIIVNTPIKGHMLSVSSGNCRAEHVIKTVVYDSELPITASNSSEFEVDTVFCGGTKYLNAPLGTSYLWSTGSTSKQIVINSAGTFSVTVTTPCTTFTKSIEMDSVSPPNIYVIDDTLCVYSLETADIISTDGHMYHWEINGSNVYVSTPFDTIPTIVYTGNSSYPSPFTRVLTVTVTDTNTGCQSSEELDIRIQSKYSSINVPNFYGCEGEVADIIGNYVNSGSEYNWITTDLDSIPIDTITESGTYLGMYESACGLFSDTSHVIIYTPDAGINEGDTAICDSALLTFTSGVIAEDIIWLKTEVTDTLFIESFNYNNGTNSTSQWSTTASFSYCTSCMSVQSGRLKSTAHTNGTTTTTFTSSVFSANPNEALVFKMDVWEWIDLQNSTEYFSVIVNGWENGNNRIDTITKQYSFYPEGITGDFDYMELIGVLAPGYDSLKFTIRAKVHDDLDSYEFDNIIITQHTAWSDTTIIEYMANSSHELILYAQSNFCQYLDTISIEVETDQPSILLETDLGCEGDTLTFSVSSNFTSTNWSTGETGSIAHLFGSDSIYAITTNSCGTVSTDTLFIPFYSLPNASISGSGISCANQTDTLIASGGTSYIWSNGSLDSVITVNPAIQTTYWVTVSDSGCYATDSFKVSVQSPPNAAIVGPNSACEGDSIELISASDTGLNHLWFNTDSAFSVSVIHSVNNTYYLIVMDGICSDTAQKAVQTLSQPGFLDVPADTSICHGDTITLAASGSGVVTWPTLSNSSSVEVSPDSSQYFVAQAQTSCSRYDTVFIEVLNLPEVSISGDSLYCAGDSISLVSTLGFQSYMWDDNTSNSTRTIYPADSHIYSITVFDGWCFGTDSHQVFEQPMVDASFSSFVSGDSVAFQWLNPMASAALSWEFGDGTIDTSSLNGTYHYMQPGEYEVCLTVVGMCNSDTSCSSIILGTASSNESRSSVYLQPNPTNRQFRLYESKVTVRSTRIFSPTGALLLHDPLGQKRDFTITGWPAGMYIVVVETAGDVFTLRLIVQ